MRRASVAGLLLAMTPVTPLAWCGGPRFVTGTQFAAAAPGSIMAFYTAEPRYFTDPGALSAGVSHAQADAMVAAAAAVWNVPTANLVLAQGGALAEHISSANTYFNGGAVVFPADVQPSNYLSRPIAVVYDTDGSVTDLLLGSGASAPSGCRQNGVTTSVDGFGPSGTLQHAVMVLNGRCVASTGAPLLQMQYQVMRAFGRVLGLAWSQVNDNVFTGATAPSAGQMAHWPVMHPIDIVCGLYTYQCMANAFTLRADDLSTLALLYPVKGGNALPGKTPSLANAASAFGTIYFPTYQGMELLNVTVVEMPAGQSTGWDRWQVVSGVSGLQFQQNGGNPVAGVEPEAENSGSSYAGWEGEFVIGAIPMEGPATALLVQQEAINPLYTGDYAIGPYQRPPPAISGSSVGGTSPFTVPDENQLFNFTLADAASVCSPGSDGVEAAPAAVDSSGWWTGLLCGLGHSSWWSVSIKAGHSWTLETTALDAAGVATLQKVQPVLGVWNAADPVGTLPTVAAQAAAMNSMVLGMTQLTVAAALVDGSYRFVVADQFGAGRPDFTYRQRVLYADSVAPAVVGVGGGGIVITGMGFRLGNQVRVNGVAASVLSWSATQIVAIAPAMAAAGATVSVAVRVSVVDASTGGETVIGGALSYSSAVGVTAVGPPAQIVVVSGAGQSVALSGALQPVVLQVQDSNGNPVPSAEIAVYQTAYAWEGACPAQGPCAAAPVLASSEIALTTDGNGTVSVAPQPVPGVPQVVALAAASGTQAFVSLKLQIRP